MTSQAAGSTTVKRDESMIEKTAINSTQDTPGPSASASGGFFSSAGRIGRVEYFWTQLLAFCTAWLVGNIAERLGGRGDFWSFLVAAAIVSLALYLSIVAAIKRFHDLGKSGWWLLPSMIPVVNIVAAIYLLFTRGDSHANEYGSQKQSAGSASLKVPFQEANKDSGPPASIPTPTGMSKSSQLKISTSAVSNGFDEDAAYSEVAHELETKTMDKGLWLKAMLQTGDGDERQQAMAYTRMRLITLEAAFAATSTVSSTPAANPSLESIAHEQEVQPVSSTSNSDMDPNRPPSMHASDAWTYAAAAAVLIVFLYLMSNTTTPPVSEAPTSTGATGEPLDKQREIAKYEAAPTQSTESAQPASLGSSTKEAGECIYCSLIARPDDQKKSEYYVPQRGLDIPLAVSPEKR